MQDIVAGRIRPTALGVAVAAFVLVAVLAAAPADARLADDPCGDHGPGYLDPSTGSFYGPEAERPAGAERLIACGAVAEVSPWRTELHEAECPDLYKVAGTTSTDKNDSTAHWDFWSKNGEWVTWTGGGDFVGGFTEVAGGIWRTYVRGYRAALHNWRFPGLVGTGKSGGWPVRVIAHCDRPASKSGTSAAFSPTLRRDGDARDQAMDGTAGDDELRGHKGDDETDGGRGDDLLLGGAGDDTSHGGRGDDELFDNHGHDRLWGGKGDDHFSTHDGNTDRIHCGAGTDVVYADYHDQISADCERAHVIGRVPADRHG